MCIAIPPPGTGARRPVAPPRRLYFTGAALQSGLLLALAGLAAAGSPVRLPQGLSAGLGWALAGLYGVVPFLLLGHLLEALPRRLGVGEPDYLRYGGAFFLLSGGLFLAWTGVFLGPFTLAAGIGLVLAGGLPLLGYLGGAVRWAPARERLRGRAIRHGAGLCWAGIGAAGAGALGAGAPAWLAALGLGVAGTGLLVAGGWGGSR